jgi:hypothetical protein
VTTQRASRIAGGIAFVAVLSVVGTVAWSLLNRSDHVPPLPLAEGPALGDLTGYVGRIDPGARTIDIAEDLSGLRSVAMVVTDDTSIMVGDKRGGIGDLSKDLPVRAFYEVRNDVTYVTSIQVIIDEAKGTAAATTPAVAPPPPSRPAAPAPSTATIAPRPVPAPPRATAPPAAASVGPPPAAVARPAPTVADDGSAVIDWLFESRRR